MRIISNNHSSAPTSFCAPQLTSMTFFCASLARCSACRAQHREGGQLAHVTPCVGKHAGAASPALLHQRGACLSPRHACLPCPPRASASVWGGTPILHQPCASTCLHHQPGALVVLDVGANLQRVIGVGTWASVVRFVELWIQYLHHCTSDGIGTWAPSTGTDELPPCRANAAVAHVQGGAGNHIPGCHMLTSGRHSCAAHDLATRTLPMTTGSP